MSGGWRKEPHTGVDIEAVVGDAVLAAADGCVFGSYRDDKAGGILLVFHPDLRRFTRYVHLDSAHVWASEWVRRGQRIGTVGLFPLSGAVPHLHWEMWPQSLGPWTNSMIDPRPEDAFCSDERAPLSAFVLPIKCRTDAPEATPARVRGCVHFLSWWIAHMPLRELRLDGRGPLYAPWKSSPDDRWVLERRVFELRDGPLR